MNRFHPAFATICPFSCVIQQLIAKPRKDLFIQYPNLKCGAMQSPSAQVLDEKEIQ
jgi:hypothetical protein